MGLISRVSSRTYREIMSLETASKNSAKIKKSSDIPYKSTVIDIFLSSDKLELDITTIKTEAENRRHDKYNDTALMVAVLRLVDDEVLIKIKNGIFRFNKSRFLKILELCYETETCNNTTKPTRKFKVPKRQFDGVCIMNKMDTLYSPSKYMLNLTLNSPKTKQLDSNENLAITPTIKNTNLPEFPYYPSNMKRPKINREISQKLKHKNSLKPDLYNKLILIGAKKFLKEEKQEGELQNPKGVIGNNGKGNCFLSGLNQGFYK